MQLCRVGAASSWLAESLRSYPNPLQIAERLFAPRAGCPTSTSRRSNRTLHLIQLLLTAKARGTFGAVRCTWLSIPNRREIDLALNLAAKTCSPHFGGR